MRETSPDHGHGRRRAASILRDEGVPASSAHVIESVRLAVALARRFWHLTGSPERTHLISRTNAYHGTHGFGTSLAGIPGNRDTLKDLLSEMAAAQA